MNITKILVFGSIFGIIGFGVGRLRLHALSRRKFQQRSALRAVEARGLSFESNAQLNVTVWATLYAQSSILHANITKYISTITLAILGYAATLLANNKIIIENPIYVFFEYFQSNTSKTIESQAYAIFSFSALGLSLLFSLGAIEKLAYHHHKHADKILRSFNKNPTKIVPWPESQPPLNNFLYTLLAFLLTSLGALLLFRSYSFGLYAR